MLIVGAKVARLTIGLLRSGMATPRALVEVQLRASGASDSLTGYYGHRRSIHSHKIGHYGHERGVHNLLGGIPSNIGALILVGPKMKLSKDHEGMP